MKSPLPTPILPARPQSPRAVFPFLSTRKFDYLAYGCLQSIILASLAFVLAVVPHIARLHFDENLLPQLGPLGFRGRWGDLFHWYKDSAVSVCAVFATVAALGSMVLRPHKSLPKAPYLLLGGLAAVMLLSWRLSDFGSLAWRGAPGTYEGVMVHLGYVALAASASVLDLTSLRITVLLGALGVGLAGAAVGGLPEVFGIHPLLSEWAQQYVLGIDPEHGSGLTRSTHRYATAMLSHSNYLGTYSGMVGLVFLTYACLAPSNRTRVIGSSLAVVALLLLVASFSRVAYGSAVVSVVGLVFLMMVFGLVNSKSLNKISLIGGILICSLGALLRIFEPVLATQLWQRVSSIAAHAAGPNPHHSRVEQDHDHMHIALEGAFISITAPQTTDFVVTTAEGVPLTPGYEGYELVQGQVETMPALFVKRGPLKVTVVSTPLGLRIFSRGALLRPEKAVLTALPIRDDFANRRGFIWKRTLPLIRAAPWFGYAPGTFMLHYPNRDFTGFLNTFGLTGILIDKPHNFYLQYAYHFGLLGLGLYAAVAWTFVTLCLKDLRGYRASPSTAEFSSFKLACLLGVVCFWGCGLTTDSMSGVTPIAWILMGLHLVSVPKPAPPPMLLTTPARLFFGMDLDRSHPKNLPGVIDH